jgi:hypothetical protein
VASRELRVSFVSDTKALERGFNTAESRTAKFAKTAARVGLVAGGVLAAGLVKSVQAAAEAEKAQARMEAQLKASGISLDTHGAAIEAVIQKHSRLAGLDDEQLQDAFTNIVRATGDVTKSMNLVGLAADFARAKNIDAAKAGEIIGKVAGGNTGILARYGIQIEKGATATQALGELQKRFAGQAEAYGKTAAGAQDRFRVAVENLQEKIGAHLLPVISRVANAVSKFITEMETGTGSGGKFARAMQDIGEFMTTYIIPAVALVIAAFRRMGGILGDVIAFQLRALDKWLGVLSTIAGKFTWLPKVGGEFRKMQRSVDKAREGIRATANALDSLNNKTVNIKFKYTTEGDPLRNKQGKMPSPGAGAAAAWRPSYAQQVAESDVLIAQTGFTIGGIYPLEDQYVKALTERKNLLGKRMNSVRGAIKQTRARLRRRLSKKNRKALADKLLRLTQEESALSAEINAIAGTIVDLATDEATPVDAGAAVAGAGEAGDVPAGDLAPEVVTTDPALEEANRLQQEANDRMKALADELKRSNEFSRSVTATQLHSALRAMADFVSGEIHGNVDRKAALAGAGSVYRA